MREKNIGKNMSSEFTQLPEPERNNLEELKKLLKELKKIREYLQEQIQIIETEFIGKEILFDFQEQFSKSLRSRNGDSNQIIATPEEKLIFQYLGREKIGDKVYEKYVSKHVCDFVKICGAVGWRNWNEESERLSQIFKRGRANDGRKIEYVRLLKSDDINQLLDVKVDYTNGRVSSQEQLLYEDKSLGKSYMICKSEIKEAKKFDVLLGNKDFFKISDTITQIRKIKNTYYCYKSKKLRKSQNKKVLELIFNKSNYLLGDTCTRIENEQYISFYIRSVYDNCVGAYKLFDPTTIIGCNLGVRLVVYLMPNKQSMEIKLLEALEQGESFIEEKEREIKEKVQI